jgi:GlpG protein
MRFLIQYDDECRAYGCTAYLQEQKIAAICEPSDGLFSVWVIEEGDYERAQALLPLFTALPSIERAKFAKPRLIAIPKSALEDRRAQVALRVQRPRLWAQASHRLTQSLILLCVSLFLVNGLQNLKLIEAQKIVNAEAALTPLQRAFFFDDPHCYGMLEGVMLKYPIHSYREFTESSPHIQQLYAAAESCSMWKGLFSVWRGEGSLHAPMFEKIRQGEVWRLITPIFLHRDFLHILFNMAWLLMLGRVVEERLGKWRMLILIGVIAILSNVGQYLIGGPFFLGFSGVIVGLAGFIWMRQQLAPRERYSVPRSSLLFLFIFVLMMALLELGGIFLHFFGLHAFMGGIANTAHLIGGGVGLLLGRISYFSSSPS